MAVNSLYKEVAEFHGITVKELIKRITEGGETLVQQYWAANGYY